MSEKIELKDKLAAVDLGARSLWDEITDEQRKSLKRSEERRVGKECRL